MSRSYLLYVEFEGLWADQVWSFFSKWCGHSQIFKVCFDEADKEEGGYVYCEMGCSGGVHVADMMFKLKRQLEKIGAKKIEMKCWSMHPDNCAGLENEVEQLKKENAKLGKKCKVTK